MPSFSKIILTTVLITFAAAAPMPQIHGEGAAADAIFTSIDNGIGYSSENVLNTVANTIKPGSAPTGNTGAGSNNADKRQLDKTSQGLQNVANALGVGQSTQSTTDQLKGLDGTLTNGAGNAGLAVGNAFANTLEDATATPANGPSKQ